ncbi:MAG: Nramp family divalent metal transporter [Phycisphaerales bacterium]|nr:Nramp family divalent metal transporter [Phycisphaerales bacterium]
MTAQRASSRSLMAVFGPGLLVAATGVGAGDLATAGFAGAKLGTTILWAVVLGALMKFVLTEGIARWQVASQETLVAGVGHRLGRWVLWAFLLYLLPWMWVVAGALISAAGASSQALLPLPVDPLMAKLIWGGLWSLICLGLVWRGGFRVFEICMAASVLIMVTIVVVTAILVDVDGTAAVRGLVIPDVPDVDGGLSWTMALIGGVGGTVTMLCYGYWLTQQHGEEVVDVRACRIDLAAGYLVTAVFGVAMVLIASGLPAQDGSGVTLLISIAHALEAELGSWSRWIFLLGGWAAIVSSMLGVWQSVPMIFADVVRGAMGRTSCSPNVLERSSVARWCLVLLATAPAAQAIMSFEKVQLIYTTSGAFFLPLLAVVLLLLLRKSWCGPLASGWLARLATAAVLGFFVWMALF